MTMTENFMDKEPADRQASILNDRESMEQGGRLYFAYGSNMDLDQELLLYEKQVYNKVKIRIKL